MASEELSKEIIQDTTKWPRRPVLPVKNPSLYETSIPAAFGIIWEDAPLTVQIDSGDPTADINIAFASIEDLLAAGWRVD
jgi:hypothetical protein